MRRLLFSPNTNKGVSQRHLHDLWDTPFLSTAARKSFFRPILQLGKRKKVKSDLVSDLLDILNKWK